MEAGSGPLISPTLLSPRPAAKFAEVSTHCVFSYLERDFSRWTIFQAPSGKRLGSMVEVQKYLIELPEYMVDGLSMSQFSFQIPRPLQENYVRKRPAAPCLTAAANSGRPLEPTEANPIADDTDFRLGSAYLEAHVFDILTLLVDLQRSEQKQE